MFVYKVAKLFVILLCFKFSKTDVPDFIKICKKSDPNLNECAIQSANIAIPELVKGYRPFKVPKLSPLHIPEINIQAGHNLKILLTDNQVYGLETSNIYYINMQMDKKHMTFKVKIPKASIEGNYKMNGRILILPIQGEGRANVTLMNGDYTYEMDFTFVDKKGKDYLQITKHSITFTTTRAYYQFENLFGGDARLGSEVGKFLDENWEEVTKDLGSTVAETISSIITSIVQNVFDEVPFEVALPD